MVFELGPRGIPFPVVGKRTVDIVPLRQLTVGDLAPSFTVERVDGTQIQLEQFRGKYVLLTFFDSLDPKSRRELSYLSSIYAAVSDDDRIAIVSLDLAPKHVAARQSLDWNHGIISAFNDAEILNDFGFSYHVQEQLPMTVLVDPDGRIIENRLRGERIQAAVKSSISCQ